MSESSVVCPRCNETVEDLRFVPPDLLTRDILADVGYNDQDSSDDGLEVCGSCFADIEGG